MEQKSQSRHTRPQLQTTDINSKELGALLKACAAAEQSALKSLYRHTAAPLFSVILRLVKIHSVAEDILRDTYVTVWRRAQEFGDSGSSPMGWMAQIARRLARIRMLTEEYRVEINNMADAVPLSNPEVYFARLQQHPDLGALPRTLRKLSSEARYLILLAYCDGASISTLSQQLGITEVEARQVIHGGLEALLKEDDDDED